MQGVLAALHVDSMRCSCMSPANINAKHRACALPSLSIDCFIIFLCIAQCNVASVRGRLNVLSQLGALMSSRMAACRFGLIKELAFASELCGNS